MRSRAAGWSSRLLSVATPSLTEARWREFLASTAFIAATLLLYGIFIPAPRFIDDWALVANAPVLRLPPASFAQALISRSYFDLTGERTWQPLVTLFHYCCRTLTGQRLTGILLHGLNALLLRAVVKRMGASERCATITAALWLVFPFHSEAVYVSVFKGHLIAAASALACLYTWERACANEIPDRRWLAASWVAFAIGLLGKETAVAGPALIVLRTILGDPARRWARVRLLAGHAAIASTYAVWRFGILRPAPALTFSAARRPFASLGWYLSSMLWPYPACFVRTLPLGLWPALLVLPFGGLAWLKRDRSLVLQGLLWIPVTLLPFLHAVPFAHYSPVADRYLYLPVAGACLTAAAILAETRARLALVVVGTAWAILLMGRNGQLRSAPALIKQTVACAPDNPMSYRIAGLNLLRAGDFPAARRNFAFAAASASGNPDFLNEYGVVCLETGDPEGARVIFERLLAMRSSAVVSANLHRALTMLGRGNEVPHTPVTRRASDPTPGADSPH